MKTLEQLCGALSVAAPSVSIETIWKHDLDSYDIRKDCDGFENEDPDDWRAWFAEVRATVIEKGVLITGSSYLSSIWERVGENPAESNPDISGYAFDMAVRALTDLLEQLPNGNAEITNALKSLNTKLK